MRKILCLTSFILITACSGPKKYENDTSLQNQAGHSMGMANRLVLSPILERADTGISPWQRISNDGKASSCLREEKKIFACQSDYYYIAATVNKGSYTAFGHSLKTGNLNIITINASGSIRKTFDLKIKGDLLDIAWNGKNKGLAIAQNPTDQQSARWISFDSSGRGTFRYIHLPFAASSLAIYDQQTLISGNNQGNFALINISGKIIDQPAYTMQIKGVVYPYILGRSTDNMLLVYTPKRDSQLKTTIPHDWSRLLSCPNTKTQHHPLILFHPFKEQANLVRIEKDFIRNLGNIHKAGNTWLGYCDGKNVTFLDGQNPTALTQHKLP